MLVLFSPRSPDDAIIRDHKLKDITGVSRRISDVSFYQSTEVNDVGIEYSVKNFRQNTSLCNRQFQEEWNNKGSHMNEERIIHYLRYSYMWELRKHTTQYMKSKYIYAVVLMQESHRKYIPDCYLLSLKGYQFSQIEEIASHILEQPLYRFLRDMQMPCTSVDQAHEALSECVPLTTLDDIVCTMMCQVNIIRSHCTMYSRGSETNT